MDLYNGELIRDIISKKQRLDIFPQCGFQGIVTGKYLYAKYNIGKEVLLKRNNIIMTGIEYFTLEDEIEDAEMLPFFRSMLTDTTEIYKDKKFKYSKYLRKVYENCKNLPDRKAYILNELFSSFANQSVALRMGGQHTIGIWRMLSEDNRKKINCIVDRSPDCMASVLGYPIVADMENVNYDDVKICIPSSFAFRKVLEMELRHCPVDVIDIYEYMRKHGVKTEKELYTCEALPDEVYDVGFPFEDFE